jgi:hypothetical protein
MAADHFTCNRALDTTHVQASHLRRRSDWRAGERFERRVLVASCTALLHAARVGARVPCVDVIEPATQPCALQAKVRTEVQRLRRYSRAI